MRLPGRSAWFNHRGSPCESEPVAPRNPMGFLEVLAFLAATFAVLCPGSMPAWHHHPSGASPLDLLGRWLWV